LSFQYSISYPQPTAVTDEAAAHAVGGAITSIISQLHPQVKIFSQQIVSF